MSQNYFWIFYDIRSGCESAPFPLHSHTQNTRGNTVIEAVLLAQVQNPAMKSAWESSGGPKQDTEKETEREKRDKGLLSPDKIPLFICPTFLHTSLPLCHQPFLFGVFRNPKAQRLQKPIAQIKAECQSLENHLMNWTRCLTSPRWWKVKMCHNSGYKRMRQAERKMTVLLHSSQKMDFQKWRHKIKSRAKEGRKKRSICSHVLN